MFHAGAGAGSPEDVAVATDDICSRRAIDVGGCVPLLGGARGGTRRGGGGGGTVAGVGAGAGAGAGVGDLKALSAIEDGVGWQARREQSRRGRGRGRDGRRAVIGRDGGLEHDPDDDGHAIIEVLVAGDQGVGPAVLEGDAADAAGALVEAVEVLDGGDDGIGRVMGMDVDSHR